MSQSQQRDLFGVGLLGPGSGADPAPRTAADRAEVVRQPQQRAVLAALFHAYPNPISHAEICEQTGIKWACGRVSELVEMGWEIDGSGILPLDEDSQTQLYRLTSPMLGAPRRKLMGLTARWVDGEGLRVEVHKNARGPLPPALLDELAGEVHRLITDKLAAHISPTARGEMVHVSDVVGDLFAELQAGRQDEPPGDTGDTTGERTGDVQDDRAP